MCKKVSPLSFSNIQKFELDFFRQFQKFDIDYLKANKKKKILVINSKLLFESETVFTAK